MKKRYSSPCMKFAVNIKKDGKQLPIVFPLWENDTRRRYIIVEDEEVQSKMEASPDFGTYFHLDYAFEDTDEALTEVIQETTNPQHEEENLAAAKKYLAELGVKVYPSMNKAKAIEAAKEKQIELIIKN